MHIEHYHNDPPQTPYTPLWDYYLGFTELPLRVDKLALICLEKEKEILKLPARYHANGKEVIDGYTGLGKNNTTAKHRDYNVLEWNTPETNNLKKYIRKSVGEYNRMIGNETPEHLWVRCWVNILRFGQRINPHMHTVKANSYLSGHFTIQCRNTSTCYINPVNVLNDPEVIKNKNHPGEFTIFPSYVPHYTTRHYSFIPRITLAMDFSLLYPFEMVDRRQNWVML